MGFRQNIFLHQMDPNGPFMKQKSSHVFFSSHKRPAWEHMQANTFEISENKSLKKGFAFLDIFGRYTSQEMVAVFFSQIYKIFIDPPCKCRVGCRI